MKGVSGITAPWENIFVVNATYAFPPSFIEMYYRQIGNMN